MKAHSIAGSLGFGALMFIAGYGVNFTEGVSWIVFGACCLGFIITLINGWTN